ncbi:MAG: 30S ribosomal protein S6e [Candidatus Korarchaeota archaeon NZ13-K]|nr:MAG: 30S ribosomal protein S6e [Candidatus Korarchaeota archaeon NZ13-K]
MSASRRRGVVEEFLALDIGDPGTGRTFHLKMPKESLRYFMGKRIGEEISGDPIGLPGYTLMITGGTDKDGFPMHPSLPIPGRKRVLLSSPPGFHPRREGERRAKLVRGSIISEATRQINLKVVRRGERPLEELVGGEAS